MARNVAALAAINVGNASRNLASAKAEWLRTQTAFIEARYTYDAKRFSNRVQETQLRLAFKDAQNAARAAMDAYYQAVDLANKVQAVSG